MPALNRTIILPGILGLLTTSIIVSAGSFAIAQSTEEMLATAERACIDAAVAKGYDSEQSQVISAESIDADTVEVVLNVTKDGTGFARLTCPFSVNEGLAVFDDANAVFENAADTVTGAASDAAEAIGDATSSATDAIGDAASSATDAIGDAASSATDAIGDATSSATDAIGDAASSATDAAGDATDALAEATDDAVDVVATRSYSPLWWLLLPLIGLPLLLLFLRGRDRNVAATTDYEHTSKYSEGVVHTYGNLLNVYETPSQASRVIRTLKDGTRVLFTGRQDDYWLELRDGGWVNMNSLRLTESSTRENRSY